MRTIRVLAFFLLSFMLIVLSFYACDTESADDAVVSVPIPTPAATPTPSGPLPTPTPNATPIPEFRVVTDDFAFNANDALSTVGLGAVTFGQTPDEASASADVEWLGVPDLPWPTCFVITPIGGPPELSFSVVDGIIRRVDVGNDLISTRSGARVNTDEERILTMFGGNLQVDQLEDGKRIWFIPTDEADQDFRIVWMTDGEKVTAMRSGQLPYVESEAPC